MMISPLGLVSVGATKVVKVVSMVGMGIAGMFLAESALTIMVPGAGAIAALEVGRELLMFGSALAGWEFADWAGSKLQVNEIKSAQAAELSRLQSYHGQAL